SFQGLNQICDEAGFFLTVGPFDRLGVSLFVIIVLFVPGWSLDPDRHRHDLRGSPRAFRLGLLLGLDCTQGVGRVEAPSAMVEAEVWCWRAWVWLRIKIKETQPNDEILGVLDSFSFEVLAHSLATHAPAFGLKQPSETLNSYRPVLAGLC